DFVLLVNTKGEFYTLEEYNEKVKGLQTDKSETTVYLYTSNAAIQDMYIQAANKKDYDVLVMDSPLDNHFINHLEQKLEKVSLKRVDADIIDKLIQKEDQVAHVLTEEQSNKVKEIFEKAINKPTMQVAVESLSPDDMPVTVTINEFMRRMKDM